MINKIKFFRMHLDDYLLLGTKILDILDKEDELALQLGVPVAKIRETLAKLKEGRKIVAANLRTEELAYLDTRRDDAWVCFYHLILSQVRCLDDSVREYAHKLEVLITMPEMRIHKLGYQKQSASMINFFNRIDSNPELVEALEKISGQQRYTELKSAQEAFTAKESERVDQEALKPHRNGVEAAKDLRKAIENLSQFLTVMLQITGKDAYAKIIDKINEVVSEINARVLAQATRRQSAKEEQPIEG